MKKRLLLIFSISVILMLAISSVAFADNASDNNVFVIIPVGISDEDTVSLIFESEDDWLDGATLISKEEIIADGKLTTIKTYVLSDGTEIVDEFTVNLIQPLSTEGTSTSTRKSTIKNFGGVTITSTFSWKIIDNKPSVKCDSMSSTYWLETGQAVVEDKMKAWYIKDWTTASAYAQVDYVFYTLKIPINSASGSFRVTCTTTGVVSDDGLK